MKLREKNRRCSKLQSSKVDQLLECFFFSSFLLRLLPPFYIYIIFFVLRHSRASSAVVFRMNVRCASTWGPEHSRSGCSYTHIRQSRNINKENKNIDTQIIENRLFNVNCLNDEKSMRDSLFHVECYFCFRVRISMKWQIAGINRTKIETTLRGAAWKWWILLLLLFFLFIAFSICFSVFLSFVFNRASICSTCFQLLFLRFNSLMCSLFFIIEISSKLKE